MKKHELIFLKKHGWSLAGKTVAITGASGDLGKEVCRNVLALGGDLILMNRSEKKTKLLTRKLLQEFPGSKIRFIPVDLTCMEQVRQAAHRLEQESFDVLVLNAGAYSIPRTICSTGFDNVFQINFVSHYYLVRRLLPVLLQRGVHVTAVGSIAHSYSKADPADIDFSGRNGCALVYGNSKRYLMHGLWALQKKYTGLQLSIAHPGISFTNITAHYPKLIFALIKYPMKVIFMPPRLAVRSIVQGIMEPQQPCFWIGPRLFNIWGDPSVKKLRSCTGAEFRLIAAESERIYKTLAGQDEA